LPKAEPRSPTRAICLAPSSKWIREPYPIATSKSVSGFPFVLVLILVNLQKPRTEDKDEKEDEEEAFDRILKLALSPFEAPEEPFEILLDLCR
jgi:hypothetical protein